MSAKQLASESRLIQVEELFHEESVCVDFDSVLVEISEGACITRVGEVGEEL